MAYNNYSCLMITEWKWNGKLKMSQLLARRRLVAGTSMSVLFQLYHPLFFLLFDFPYAFKNGRKGLSIMSTCA